MSGLPSATITATPNVLKSLGFDKLSQGVSLYTPSDANLNNASSRDPTLIILCSWAFAQPKHISKYVQPYQELYLSTSILLVQNIIANAVWKPDSWQLSFFQPAATAIQAHVSRTIEPRVLLHAFSNGGSHAAVQLSEACRETCGGMRLPVDALLLDSCPGIPRFWPTIRALTQGIPSKNPLVKATGTVLAFLSVSLTALLDMTNISEPAVWKLYRKLNDPVDAFLLTGLSGEKSQLVPVPRTYIFSKSDTMIMDEDVVGHARIATEKLLGEGFSQVEAGYNIHLEEFHGTAHVNHVKNDRDRYWEIVEDTRARRTRERAT